MREPSWRANGRPPRQIETIGATGWAQKAREELGRVGGRTRHEGSPPPSAAWPSSSPLASRTAAASGAATAFRCDNCFGVCPDNAVIKLVAAGADGRRYAFDYDFCKGRGMCVAECPSGAIEMVPETI